MNGAMKVAAIEGERHAAVVDVPAPHAADEFAVVKVLAAPMCTEYKMYRNGSASQVIGHEAAGEVVEIARPGRVKVGDRVVVMPLYPCGTCRYCVGGEFIHCEHSVDPLAATGNSTGVATYAQYLIKQDWLLLPVPDDIAIDHAAMACCGLGPTFGALERMGVDAFDTVLITGLGPVGLGGVINARYRGSRVLAVESNPYRASLARELGAEEVFDPGDPDTPARIRDRTGGVGVDACVDCTGVPAAQRLLIDSARRRGSVAFVGEGAALEISISTDMIRKGLTLEGSWHYNLADYPKILQIIRSSGEKLSRMITHEFPLAKVADAWELQLTGECGKVVLHPWS